MTYRLGNGSVVRDPVTGEMYRLVTKETWDEIEKLVAVVEKNALKPDGLPPVPVSDLENKDAA